MLTAKQGIYFTEGLSSYQVVSKTSTSANYVASPSDIAAETAAEAKYLGNKNIEVDKITIYNSRPLHKYLCPYIAVKRTSRGLN